MVPLPVDFDHGDIKSEAGQFVAQGFAFGGDTEPMQLLFHSVEILHRRVRFATLTQNLMELIHRAGLTGQAGTVLQCLHGGSPLAYVV
jgi:hypothetical protein